MGRLLEGDSLKVLERYGVPTVPWTVVGEPSGAKGAFAGRVVVKAHVPVGGRGKGGVVRVTEDPEAAAAELLGRSFQGFPIEEVLISPAVEVKREFFAAIALDQAPVALFSADGGVDVDHAVRQAFDIRRGLLVHQSRELLATAGLRGGALIGVAAVFDRLYRAFRGVDALLVEVNPLVELQDGRMLAVSAVVHVDDRAAFRQPDLPETLHNGWRPLTPAERAMRRIDALDPEVGHIRFNELSGGSIALMVTGGGGGAIAYDTLTMEGFAPACAFDISIGDIEAKVYQATRLILALPNLRALVAASNFTSFAPVTARANGIIRAVRECRPAFPVVMRFCGPGQAEAAAAAQGVEGLTWCDERTRIDEAVALAASQARKAEAMRS